MSSVRLTRIRRLPPICAAALLSILAGILPPGQAQACACCSEEGQRFTGIARFSQTGLPVLQELRFDPAASLYQGAGFPESVKGVHAPPAKPYALKTALAAGALELSLSRPESPGGHVRFILPETFMRLEVDPRVFGGRSPGGGPVLYKEWRFDGTVALTGAFAAARKSAKGELVLHGSGNSCTDYASFSHWTLSVRGEGVDFTLVGTFNR
ncbi:MAG: hypothetical protein AB7F96_07150 [Beijerinckiaceae bacterium]